MDGLIESPFREFLVLASYECVHVKRREDVCSRHGLRRSAAEIFPLLVPGRTAASLSAHVNGRFCFFLPFYCCIISQQPLRALLQRSLYHSSK